MAMQLSGSLVISGSIIASAGITGSFSGSATSASYADTLGGLPSSSFAPAATFNTVSQSFATTSGSIAGRMTIVEGQDATTGSNTFTGVQYVSEASNAISFTSTASLYTDGGLRVAKDSFVSGTAYFNNITVYGTSSIEYITSSQVNIGSNVITVNTDTPAIRFGGLSVFDSGSTGLTGSLFWDSEKNHWIYSNPSGSSYNSAMLMNGPRNTGSLGDEQGTTNNALMKGQGGDHITSSQMIDDGTTVQIPGNLQVTGSLVGSSTAAFSSSVTANGVMSLSDDGTYGSNYKTLGFTGNTNGNHRIFAGVTDGMFICSKTAEGIFFRANGGTTNNLTIASTGNVGIGTTTPDFPLTIKTDASANSLKIIGRSGGDSLLSFYASNGTTPYLDFSAGATYVNYNAVNSQNYNWYCNSSLKMVLTSGGNVGIGTSSPSAVDITLNVKGITGATNASIVAESFDATKFVMLYSGVGGGDMPSIIYAGDLRFGNGPKSTSSYTERMRITSGGNVGIGITPSAWLNTDGYAALQVGNASLFGRNATNSELYLSSNAYDNTSGNPTYITDTFATRYVMNTGIHRWLSAPSGAGGGAITFTESMRITAGRQVFIGTTTSTADGKLVVSGNAAGGTNNVRLEFTTEASYGYFQCADRVNVASKRLYIDSADLYINYLGTGTVYSNGSVLTNTNPSDARLKENINDIAFGLNEILQLRPVEYNWINDKANQGKQYGFIAQEVQPIIPSLVKEFTIPASELEGTEEVVRLGLEKDGIYVALVKAIQELEARVKELENK